MRRALKLHPAPGCQATSWPPPAPRVFASATSYHFCCTGVVPAGYGDITPYTISEVAVTMLFEVVGGERVPASAAAFLLRTCTKAGCT